MLAFVRSKLTQWERASVAIVDWNLRATSAIDLECAIVKRLLRDQHPTQFYDPERAVRDEDTDDEEDGSDDEGDGDHDMTMRVRDGGDLCKITGFSSMCRLLGYLAYRLPSRAVDAARLETAIALHARFMTRYRDGAYDEVYDILKELASSCMDGATAEDVGPLCDFDNVTLADILWHETIDWLTSKTIWFDEKRCPAIVIHYAQTMATYE